MIQQQSWRNPCTWPPGNIELGELQKVMQTSQRSMAVQQPYKDRAIKHSSPTQPPGNVELAVEADSGNKEKPSSHPTRSQTTRGRYTRGPKAQDTKTSRPILQSIPSHSTAVCQTSTESHQSTILNPAAISPQSVHMTAGEYRTSRGDDQPVKSNWDLFLHPTHTKASNTRPLKGGTPRIQKDHHRHLFLAALPSFTQDSHAITTISMQSSILQQSPCNSWTKPPGNIELGEHWEGIIVGRLLINPKSKHSFKEWTETREWK